MTLTVENHLEKMAEEIAEIIKDELPDIETIETRNSDSLDFHDVNIRH